MLKHSHVTQKIILLVIGNFFFSINIYCDCSSKTYCFIVNNSCHFLWFDLDTNSRSLYEEEKGLTVWLKSK